MTKSEIAEEAWRRAASYLGSDILARRLEVPAGDLELSILEHMEKIVVKSLLQRASIIRRNRKDWSSSVASTPDAGAERPEI